MSKEELIKILEDYEIFVDDDFGGNYQSIIAYTPDKKVSRAHAPIGTLKIIDTFEEIQNQNKRYKEVIDKAIKYIEQHAITVTDGTITTNKHELLEMLKEVE